MNRPKLARARFRQLESQLRETSDARVFRRTLAVLEYGRGPSVADIAETVRASRQSVYNWIEGYHRRHDPSALADRARSGRPCLWTEERQALLRSLLKTSPDRLGYVAVIWTVPLLQAQIERATGWRPSDEAVRRELHRQGYVWKRPRYVLEPDPDREKKTLDHPVCAVFEQADA
jgi:transposase